MAQGKFTDLTGKRYGRLKVLKREGSSKRGKPTWLCRCDCGMEVLVRGDSLYYGLTTSCGCYSLGTRIKHGYAKRSLNLTPEYRAWAGMIRRCENKKERQYELYGGRGITVCGEWRNDFSRFLTDMGLRTSKHHSLDRINTNGNYEPSNCRWATIETQNQNRRETHRNKTGVRGVYLRPKGKYVAVIGAERKSFHIGTFSTIEEATRARKEAEEKYWGVS